MKILIVSDSHGLTDELTEIKETHTKEVDMMIHCGDSELSANAPSLTGFSVVQGNCDYDNKFPLEIVEAVDDFRVFITHGHRFSVKSSLMNLSYRAKELGASIVCFGHSHNLGAELIDNTLFINPGSIRLPRGRKEKTYVILEVLEDQLILHVYDLEQGKIGELTRKFPLPNRA